MVTKRNPTLEYPVQATRKLVDKIRKELSCTEAEAYFTLRRITSPPTDSFFAYKFLLAAHQYQKRKKCSKEEAVSFAAAHPELEQAITPWDWAIFYTWGLMGQLEIYREKTEKGHFASFLRAVEVCGFDGFPLPMWIRERIGNAHAAYRGHRAGTLDEAFGARRPLKYHQDAAYERYNKSIQIYGRCLDLKRQGVTIGGGGPFEVGPYDKDDRPIQVGEIGDGLFEIVAKEYRMSPRKIRDYYYAEKKMWDARSPVIDALLEPFKLPPLDNRPNRPRGRPPGMKGGKKKPAE